MKFERILKGIIRINIGFSLYRSWILGKQWPKGTSVHLFDIIKRKRKD
ncbi:hypothetical protein PNA2_1902 [Pyrococcus sp. NA2]|nr:hypothetical protein PNA2_1902 [Pyrococcus sp. NA2]